MGSWSREKGTIKLPSAEFVRVRRAVQDEAHKNAEAVFDHTQKFWKAIPSKAKSDPATYRSAVHAYVYGNPPRPTYHWETPASPDPDLPRFPGIAFRDEDNDGEDDQLSSAVYRKLHGVVTPSGRGFLNGIGALDGVKPRRVLKTDMEFPTNKTTSFDTCDYDGRIDFDRDSSSVTWTVNENKNAVRDARASEIFRRLSSELAHVRWTRGTGGVFTGNDEYNQEDENPGRCGNYTTAAFGPEGERQDPFECREFVDSKGVRHTRQSMVAQKVERLRQNEERSRQEEKARVSGGPQGRVSRGVPSGGQFSHQHHGESGLSL